ncbi:MAG TPA: hypothetical protein VF547_03240 [Allosphingosinicella sp.]|jgi:hypothetical protein
MIAADSRYASAPQLVYVTSSGQPVTYLAPRILPQPDGFQPVLRHRVTDSDRIDLLAWRNLGAPTAWWQIADANRAMEPSALPGAPGDVVLVPVAGTVSLVG